MWWENQNNTNIKNNMLHIKNKSVLDIVKDIGTPVFIYNLQVVKEQFEKLDNVFKQLDINNYKILYALKANRNVEIIKYLKTLGVGIDASSPAEVDFALRLGFSEEDIILTGNFLSNEDLYSMKSKSCIINFDSLSALRRFDVARGRRIGLRFNTEYGAGRNESVVTGGKLTGAIPVKFGLTMNQFEEAVEIINKKGLIIESLHHHVGSNWLANNTENYFKAFENLLKVYNRLYSEYNISVPIIDLGGGYGVPHSESEQEFPLESFFKRIKIMLKDIDLNSTKIIIEPGSFLVSSAGILVSQVNTVETKFDYNFVGLDMGLNVFNSPALYKYYHEVINCNNCYDKVKNHYNICGNICEPVDMFAVEREMPVIKEGDYLAILNAGAYGSVMSSDYNLRKRASEIIIK